MPHDYYKALELEPDATADDIKRAYRRLALKYHPDQNRGDRVAEEQFKKINEAYQVLSDPARRRQYDLFGRVELPEALREFGESIGAMLGRVFGDLFGNRKRGERGKDMKYQLEVTLSEVATGAERDIRVPRVVWCSECAGGGGRAGAAASMCAICDGSGEVRIQQGFVRLSKRCGRCGGRGRVFAEACPGCDGSGERAGEAALKVRVPAGIADGQRLRLAGEGERGRDGGENGDLFVEVKVAPHPLLVRSGSEIHCEVPVSFGDAALGAEILVPTLDGAVRLRIPRGTQTGAEFRIAGKGLPRNPVDGPRGPDVRGDEHVRVVVDTPDVSEGRGDRELMAALEKLRSPHGARGREFAGVMKTLYPGVLR